MVIKMNDKQNNMDFSGHLTHLEDAQNVQLPTSEKTYTDAELEQAGLVKTSAFVRTKKSKNALRIEKHKQKKAEQGVKQLNVEVPEQHRDMVKSFSKALKDGLSPEEAVKTLFSSNRTPAAEKPQKAPESDFESKDREYVTIGKKVAEIQSQGGFKAFILRRLI
jgi:DNA-binding transcriptional regulator YhcF (GntR family)